MKTLFLSLALFFLGTANLLANAGIFSGAGANLILSESSDLQMQSEIVTIRPEVNRKPIDMGGKNRLWARYECTFTLKNLSDKDITTRVGFPLGSAQLNDLLWSGFTASSQGLKGQNITAYNFKHIRYDKDKTFSHVFYWDMSFKAHETLTLQVNYKLRGYWGAGRGMKDRSNFEPPEKMYQNILDHSLVQIFLYVTETGNSWAKEIEHAKFIFDLSQFDEYMNQAEHIDWGKESDKEWLNIMGGLMKKGQVFRALPAHFRDDNDKIFIGEFAPFQAGETFEIAYYSTAYPKDLKGLDLLIKGIERSYAIENEDMRGRRNYKEIHFTAKDKADLADIILEFYGIQRDNDDIKEFIDARIFFRAEYHPTIDSELKAKLLEMSAACAP